VNKETIKLPTSIKLSDANQEFMQKKNLQSSALQNIWNFFVNVSNAIFIIILLLPAMAL
jgi:hypothetical protein